MASRVGDVRDVINDKRLHKSDVKQKNNQRPIVCGTDFSAPPTEAIDIAAAMARRLGTKLVLVHVDEFYGLAAVDPKLFEAAICRERRTELDREATAPAQLGNSSRRKTPFRFGV